MRRFGDAPAWRAAGVAVFAMVTACVSSDREVDGPAWAPRELELHMKIRDEFEAVIDESGGLRLLEVPPGMADAQRAFEEGLRTLRFERTIDLPREVLEEFVGAAGEASKRPQPKLWNHLTLLADSMSRSELLDREAQLLGYEDFVQSVQLAYHDSPSPRASIDAHCDGPTSNQAGSQTYVKPEYLNLVDDPDYKGEGVRIYDCEYAFILGHEDLPVVNLHHAIHGSPPEGEPAHGTSTLGVLSALADTKGMTGIAPKAELWFVSRWPKNAAGKWNMATTAACAMTEARPGDVVLLEMQRFVGATTAGPAELRLDIWESTRVACDRGVVVVAAAGNGPVDLDRPKYQEYRDYGKKPGYPTRDSGAVLVGAGHESRAPKKNSTFGCRINVQGWGEDVATLGNCGLHPECSCPQRVYRTDFSDTSAASALVAGVCAVVQSAARKILDRDLTSEEMRKLLVDTGKPQGVGDHIGPLPDVAAAITELGNMVTIGGPMP